MFDLDRFIATVSSAQQDLIAVRAGDPAAVPCFEVILEARGRAEGERLEQRLRQVLAVELTVASIFPDCETSGLTGAASLAGFYRLTVPGLDFEHLPENPFELCYFLRDVLRLESAEPCLPFLDLEVPDLADSSPWTAGSGGGKCPIGSADRGWSLRNMKIDEAWELTPRPGGKRLGEGVRIGQPDTGYCAHVDLQPPSLARELGYNFLEGQQDPRDRFTSGTGYNPGHGGSVAAVVVGRGRLTKQPPPPGSGTEGPGICAGVAPAARLIPIRAVTSVMLTKGERLPEALWHAIGPARCRVLSLSLGGILPLKVVSRALRTAVDNKVLVICAAGNYTRSVVVFPASLNYVVAAAGSSFGDEPWSGSAWGRGRIAVAAPAECVWTCWRAKDSDPLDAVGAGSGTSYATAQLAGVAALWLAFHGDRVDEFRRGRTLCAAFQELLQRTARVPPKWDSSYGAGIVNAAALLQATPELLEEIEEPAPATDPVIAGLLCLLGEAPGSDAASAVRSRLPRAFGMDTDGLSALLSEFGTELLYLLARQRIRQGATALLSDADLPDLLLAARDDASPRLAAALSRQGLG